jgi:hypothetical protein
MVREKAGASTRSDESRHLEIPAAAEKAPERTARVAKLMGKRSNFLRRANDDYPTPAKAVCPLLPHVKEGRTFIEPCAGTGQLTKHLAEAGLIPLRSYDISQGYDARVIEYPHDAEFFITNPPWTRQLLHPIIVNLKRQKPTWLLFDADWAHMIQAAPCLSFCRKIVSVGRVKWIENSSSTGRDNAAWYLFENEPAAATFYGREAPVGEFELRRRSSPFGSKLVASAGARCCSQLRSSLPPTRRPRR